MPKIKKKQLIRDLPVVGFRLPQKKIVQFKRKLLQRGDSAQGVLTDFVDQYLSKK